MKRHEKLDCRLCAQASQTREELDNHKRVNHGITKKCIFWTSGTCVDGSECLFSHGILNHNNDKGHNRNDSTLRDDNSI